MAGYTIAQRNGLGERSIGALDNDAFRPFIPILSTAVGEGMAVLRVASLTRRFPVNLVDGRAGKLGQIQFVDFIPQKPGRL